MLQCIKESRPVLRRMEKITDDNIKAIGGGDRKSAAIRNVHAQPGVFQVTRVLLEEWHGLDHLREQFHSVRKQFGIVRGRAKCDAGAEPNEQRATRIWV